MHLSEQQSTLTPSILSDTTYERDLGAIIGGSVKVSAV